MPSRKRSKFGAKNPNESKPNVIQNAYFNHILFWYLWLIRGKENLKFQGEWVFPGYIFGTRPTKRRNFMKGRSSKITLCFISYNFCMTLLIYFFSFLTFKKQLSYINLISRAFRLLDKFNSCHNNGSGGTRLVLAITVTGDDLKNFL